MSQHGYKHSKSYPFRMDLVRNRVIGHARFAPAGLTLASQFLVSGTVLMFIPGIPARGRRGAKCPNLTTS